MTRGTDARARLGVFLCALALALVAVPSAALAETIQVNSQFDAPLAVGAGCTSSAGCTLRAAIQYATANNDADDVIVVPADVYQLTVTSGTFDPEFGDLDAQANGTLDETLAIIGAGPRTTRILGLTGTFEERVLENSSSNLTLNLSGITISGGRQLGSGGGIASAGPLAVTNSTITGNLVEHRDGSEAHGGGIYTQAGVSVANSAITNNSATTENGDAFALGGGIYNGSGPSTIVNSTIAGNVVGDDDAGGAEASGGGVFNAIGGTTMSFHFATVAGNTTDGDGGGIFGGSGVTFRNTIVALNRTSGGGVSNCTPASPFVSTGNNLDETTSCGFTASDLENTNPLLGPLANNGGQTNTRALLAGSPALDAGSNTACPSVDQRGVTRPQNLICDIGAYEFAPAVILPPPPPPPDDEGLPPPRLGRTVNVREVSGRVYYAIPPRATAAGKSARASQKGLRFRPLREARQLPVRSFLNTRRGSVRLTSARPRAGKTQSGVFSRGLFQILQSRKKRAKGLTELRLKGSSFRRCKPRARKPGKDASAAISRRRIRRLRARGRGRFRTRGRYSAATVRGTKWLTQDRCDGTVTKVTQGRVAVRDFRRKRTITLKRGKSYLAKSRSRG